MMPFEALLIVAVVLPFAGSLVAVQFGPNARNAEAYLAASVALTALVIVVVFYSAVADGRVVKFEAPWVPSLGLVFVLRIDGLAWMLAGPICGIGFLVVLYARYYLSAAAWLAASPCRAVEHLWRPVVVE